MSKTEINECMEINNNTISHAKQRIKELTKIRGLIVAYEEAESADIGGVEKIDDEIATHMAAIDMAKERNAKRKKQLKLLEQLEALDNE